MMISLGDIKTLADAIQRVEGYIPPNAQYPQGSLAYQNNNPGNLRYAGQPGAVQACTQNNGCFAKFPTYDAGYQALENQIQIQAAQGQTLSQFINQYAPPADKNNTSAYLSTLVAATGASADTPLTDVISGASTSTFDTSTSGDASSASTDSLQSVADVFTEDSTSLLALGGAALLVFLIARG